MSTPRYQHIRFCDLNTGENFFYRKYRYYKANCCTGRAILDGEPVFVFPWTKVRSARPFGKPANGSTSICSLPIGSGAELGREPQAVTPGGDRTPETIGGNELTPSA